MNNSNPSNYSVSEYSTSEYSVSEYSTSEYSTSEYCYVTTKIEKLMQRQHRIQLTVSTILLILSALVTHPAYAQQAYFSALGEFTEIGGQHFFAFDLDRPVTTPEDIRFLSLGANTSTNAAGDAIADNNFDGQLFLTNGVGQTFTNDDGGDGVDALLAFPGIADSGGTLPAAGLPVASYDLQLIDFANNEANEPWGVDLIGPADALRLTGLFPSRVLGSEGVSQLDSLSFGTTGSGTNAATFEHTDISTLDINGPLVIANTGKGILNNSGDITVAGLTTLNTGGMINLSDGTFNANGGLDIAGGSLLVEGRDTALTIDVGSGNIDKFWGRDDPTSQIDIRNQAQVAISSTGLLFPGVVNILGGNLETGSLNLSSVGEGSIDIRTGNVTQTGNSRLTVADGTTDRLIIRGGRFTTGLGVTKFIGTGPKLERGTFRALGDVEFTGGSTPDTVNLLDLDGNDKFIAERDLLLDGVTVNLFESDGLDIRGSLTATTTNPFRPPTQVNVSGDYLKDRNDFHFSEGADLNIELSSELQGSLTLTGEGTSLTSRGGRWRDRRDEITPTRITIEDGAQAFVTNSLIIGADSNNDTLVSIRDGGSLFVDNLNVNGGTGETSDRFRRPNILEVTGLGSEVILGDNSGSLRVSNGALLKIEDGGLVLGSTGLTTISKNLFSGALTELRINSGGRFNTQGDVIVVGTFNIDGVGGRSTFFQSGTTDFTADSGDTNVTNGGQFLTGTGTTTINRIASFHSDNASSVDFRGDVIVDGGVLQMGFATFLLETDSPRELIARNSGQVLTTSFNSKLAGRNVTIESDADWIHTGRLEVENGSILVNGSGSTIDVSGLTTINDAGTLNLTGGGAFTVQSDFVTTGTIDYELVSLSLFEGIQVNGAATLRGDLSVGTSLSFTPTAGDTFELLRADGGISGVFNSNVFSGVPNGLAYDIQYTPNSVLLAVSEDAGLWGDFDNDGDVDADDIDFFTGNLGSPATGSLVQLDLDDTGTIDSDDLTIHVEQLVQTSNGQTGTFFGDANLDGSVDVLGDAFLLINNLGGPGGWAQGDFNADGNIDVLGDAFVLINNLGSNNNLSPLPITTAVPEPGTLSFLALAGIATGLRRRKVAQLRFTKVVTSCTRRV